MLQVVTSPSRAFARIGGDHLYQAAAVLAVSSAAGVLPFLPLVSGPLPIEYSEDFEAMGLPRDASGAAMQAVIGIAAGLISSALFYVAGAAVGGSRDWRRVFAVMLHVNVPVAIVSVALAGPAFLMAGELAALDADSLEGASDEEMLEAAGPLLAYVALMLAIGGGAAVWLVVLSVKAVRAVHGFGVLKSFGLVVLVGIATALATYPLG